MEGDDPDRTWIMPKITARAAVLTAVLVIALTGCAGTPESAPSEPEQVPTSTSEQTPEPLSVEPSETDAPADSPETKFLERVKVGLVDTELVDASDEQLLAAGEDACQQFADGVPYVDVNVIEGEVRGENGWYPYSSALAAVGGAFLCPEVYPDDAPRI